MKKEEEKEEKRLFIRMYSIVLNLFEILFSATNDVSILFEERMKAFQRRI